MTADSWLLINVATGFYQTLQHKQIFFGFVMLKYQSEIINNWLQSS